MLAADTGRFFAKWRKAWKRPVGGIEAGSINKKSSEKPWKSLGAEGAS